jgi:hypothetical protein
MANVSNTSVSAEFIIETFNALKSSHEVHFRRMFVISDSESVDGFFTQRIMPHIEPHIKNDEACPLVCPRPLTAQRLLQAVAPLPSETFDDRLGALKGLIQTVVSSKKGGSTRKNTWTSNALFDATTNTVYTTSTKTPKKFVLTNGGVPRNITRAVYKAHLSTSHTKISFKVGTKIHTMLVGEASLKQVGGGTADYYMSTGPTGFASGVQAAQQVECDCSVCM